MVTASRHGAEDSIRERAKDIMWRWNGERRFFLKCYSSVHCHPFLRTSLDPQLEAQDRQRRHHRPRTAVIHTVDMVEIIVTTPGADVITMAMIFTRLRHP